MERSRVKNKKYWQQIILGFVLVIILVSHVVYVTKTAQFPQDDEHSYLSLALQIHDILKNQLASAPADIIGISTYRQLLYPFVLSIFLLIFGTNYSYKLLLIINVVFYCGTIIMTYLLARQFVSKIASLIGSVIFAFYGFPLFYLHFLYSETATSFFVTLTLYFLASSKNLENYKKTILFSLSFAAGTLVRWMVPLFIVGPLGYSLVSSAIENYRKRKTTILKKFIIMFLFGLVPMLVFYYIPKWTYFIEYIRGNMTHSPIWVGKVSHLTQELRNTFSISSVMFYVDILAQQTVFFFILFCIGFFLCLRFWKRYLFLVLALVIPFLFLTFGSVFKQDRFIVPLYPAVAIISAVTFDHIHRIKFKSILILITLILSLLNFFGASWAVGPMGGEGLASITLPHIINYPVRIYMTPVVWPPREEHTNARLLIETILENRVDKNKKIIILATFSVYDIENGITSISSYERRDDINIIFLRNLSKNDFSKFFERVESADFILIKDQKPIDTYRYSSDEIVFMFDQFNAFYHSEHFALPGFKKIRAVKVPEDNSSIFIYKKEKKFSPEEIFRLGEAMIQFSPEYGKEIKQGMEELQSL